MMKIRLFLIMVLLPAFLSVHAADKKQPKPEKLSVLMKNAKQALKNNNNQDATRNALLGALSRPTLKNSERSRIHYTAALLEESLNGIENQKAYLRQKYDTARFFVKLRDMYEQLRLCDSIDNAPDEHGGIHPRMSRKTMQLRAKHRRNILGGGRYYMNKRQYKEAFSFFDNYCLYGSEQVGDTSYANAVRWATITAFTIEDYHGVMRHVDDAIRTSPDSIAAILMEYKVYALFKIELGDVWVTALGEGIEKYPTHDYFFVNLADYYYGLRMYADVHRISDQLISRTGGQAIHFYAKAKTYLAENDYESCIAYADSALLRQQDFVDAYYSKGVAFLNMAVIAQENSCKDPDDSRYAEDRRKVQDLYQRARPCMETVRQLQPDKTDRWASPLYRIYLNLNLGKEFSEIDKILNSKQ